jgi:hypothetical protein
MFSPRQRRTNLRSAAPHKKARTGSRLTSSRPKTVSKLKGLGIEFLTYEFVKAYMDELS